MKTILHIDAFNLFYNALKGTPLRNRRDRGNREAEIRPLRPMRRNRRESSGDSGRTAKPATKPNIWPNSKNAAHSPGASSLPPKPGKYLL